MAPIVSLRERVLRAFHADLPRLAIGLYFINAWDCFESGDSAEV